MSSTIEKALKLGDNMTDAEARLWQLIRKRQILCFKFRKQTPVGPFIADFVCFERKVVIEIDGGQNSVRKSYDEQRTAWLESQKFEVIRFRNNDVLKNSRAVVGSIYRRLSLPRPFPINGAGTPPPSPVTGE